MPAVVSEPVAGVYAITCVPTGQLYIGASSNLATRRQTHMGDLEKGWHPNKRLRSLRKKYPLRSFKWVELEVLDNGRGLVSRLRDAELRWHAEYMGRTLSRSHVTYSVPGEVRDTCGKVMADFRAMCESRRLHSHMEVIKALRAHMAIIERLPPMASVADLPSPRPRKKRKGK